MNEIFPYENPNSERKSFFGFGKTKKTTGRGKARGRQGGGPREDGNKVDNKKEKIQDWEGENSRNEKMTKRKKKRFKIGRVTTVGRRKGNLCKTEHWEKDGEKEDRSGWKVRKGKIR